MIDIGNDLREYDVKTGDSVLLVNENFSLIPPHKVRRNPEAILTRFQCYLMEESGEKVYFTGNDTLFIDEPITLVPKLVKPHIERINGDTSLFVKADRIYVGEDLVSYALRNDELLRRRLNSY